MIAAAGQQQLSFAHDHRRDSGVFVVQTHPLRRRRSTQRQGMRLAGCHSSPTHHQLWHTHKRSQVIVEHVVDQRATVRVEQRANASRHGIERGSIGGKRGAVVVARVG